MTHKFLAVIDIPLAVIVYGVTLHQMLHWVHHTDQEQVKKTAETTRRIRIRLAEVIVLVLLICFFTNVAYWIVLLCILVLLVLPSAPPDNELVMIVMLPLMAIGYVLGFIIKEYVMGLPVIALEPPEMPNLIAAENELLAKYQGKNANVTGVLRPQGEIEIDGECLAAISGNGTMISQGSRVVVIGVKNGKLLVREDTDVG